MFFLDLVEIIIFLALIFTLATTFTEVKSANKRKRRRRQGNQRQELGRMESNRKPQRAPASSVSSRRNTQKNATRTTRLNKQDEPAIDSRNTRIPSSKQRNDSTNRTRNKKQPRSLESTSGQRRRPRSLESTSRKQIPMNERRSRNKRVGQGSMGTSSSMSGVVSLNKKKTRKRKKSSSHFPAFKGKQLKQVMIYKEVLDKPVSMRDN